ncbi:hypothetical protein [Effusibacillus dendaii]|uniref:Lipoprotein n=1 Tax=Effusibacillus dendaii TaxID=2743772 RepID=A0A7I8DDC2_9BACL|nr:hypothetical protein [Effusibacillus dendaii]BCJ85891.1 hypothetical protein skT53_08760 [Effusibacillus dendaii]
MKIVNMMAAAALIGTFALAGCSSSAPSTSSSTKNETAAPTVKEGVTKLLAAANDLKTQITAGDEAKVKELGPKLEDIWKTFEDDVKPKYPDLYEKVEESLNPTIAGSKASPLDKQALSKLNDQLIQALNELADKVK